MTLTIISGRCITTCKSNGSCDVKIIDGPSGNSRGSCFPERFGGECHGIPEQCTRGNNIKTQCGSPCKDSGSNSQAQCVTICNSSGSCKVKIVNVSPGGKLSGSCYPESFGGTCFEIPDQCTRGHDISTQCGSPCKEETRNV